MRNNNNNKNTSLTGRIFTDGYRSRWIAIEPRLQFIPGKLRPIYRHYSFHWEVEHLQTGEPYYSDFQITNDDYFVYEEEITELSEEDKNSLAGILSDEMQIQNIKDGIRLHGLRYTYEELEMVLRRYLK